MEPFVRCIENVIKPEFSTVIRKFGDFAEGEFEKNTERANAFSDIDWAALDYEEEEEEEEIGSVKRELLLTYDDGLTSKQMETCKNERDLGWGAVLTTVDSNNRKLVQESFYAKNFQL